LITCLYSGIPLLPLGQRMVASLYSFPLMTIPFFVLAGHIMSEGGIAKRIVDFADILVGRMRGGLAMVNIVGSMFFGGTTGSSVADVASIGPVLIPMMESKGYEKDFAVSVTVCASTTGIILPPSHNAIIYAVAAGGTVSIGALFLAGYIPGLMIGLGLMSMSFVLSLMRGYQKEPAKSWKQSWPQSDGGGNYRRRDRLRHLYRHRIRSDRLSLRPRSYHAVLPRAEIFAAAPNHQESRPDLRHGVLPDRHFFRVRLDHGLPAYSSNDCRRYRIRDPETVFGAADCQSFYPDHRFLHGYGGFYPDLNSNFSADRAEHRYAPRSVRYHAALEPGNWLGPSSCRDSSVCWLRDSKMHAGKYRQGDLDVYSDSYFSPLAGYLCPSFNHDAAQDLHAMMPARTGDGFLGVQVLGSLRSLKDKEMCYENE
jgi:hypothetical protein